MLGERCASGGVALPSINRLIANDFHFDTVRAGECGGGRTIGGTLHVNPGIIKGAAFVRDGRRGRGVGNNPSTGVGGLDVVGYPLFGRFIIPQTVHQRLKLRYRVLVRTVGNAGIHSLADFLVYPRNRPVRRSGDKPAVLRGVFLELVELALKLPLLRVALYIGQNGLVDRIGRIVQGARVNGRSRCIGIGKLLRQGRECGNGRAHGIDLAPAQGVTFVHAGNRDASRIAVEDEFVFAPGLEPVTAVFPFSARRDVQTAPLVQVILERQRFQRTIGDGRILSDVLIRSLGRELSAMLHKIVRTQFPDIVAEVDGKADAGQNRHLKQTQSLENGSQSAHCAHKAQGHPQGTVSLAERRSLVRCSGHGDSQNPQEQRGNDGQRNQVEGAEHFKHQFRCLRTAETRAPGIPSLAEKGVQNMLAGIGLKQDFRSGGEVRRGHDCPPCRCRG